MDKVSRSSVYSSSSSFVSNASALVIELLFAVRTFQCVLIALMNLLMNTLVLSLQNVLIATVITLHLQKIVYSLSLNKKWLHCKHENVSGITRPSSLLNQLTILR